jgi:hypothetical protein
MRRLLPFILRPWTLPLVVAAIAIPIIGAFAFVGPQLGVALGAVAVAALLVFAARTRYDEPIEVAPTRDERYRLLVLAARDLSDPAAAEGVAEIAAEGARALRPGPDEPEVLVLAPAVASTLDRWATDVRESRAAAERRLAISIATLAKAGLDARGSVRDANPVQAIEDELRTFPAQEVAVLAGPALGAEEIGEIRRRLDRPVRELG